MPGSLQTRAFFCLNTRRYSLYKNATSSILWFKSLICFTPHELQLTRIWSLFGLVWVGDTVGVGHCLSTDPKTNVAPKTTVALSPIEPHWYGLTGEPSQCFRIEGQPLLRQVYCLQFFQCLFGYCCQIDPYKLWTARHQLVPAMAYGVMAYIYLSEEGEPISFQILIWFVLHGACIDHLEIIKNDKSSFATIFQAKKPKRPTGSQIKNFVQYHTYKIKVKAFTKSKTIVLLNLDLFPPLHSIAGELSADTDWGRFNCWQRFPVEESRLMVSRARK